MSFIKNETYSIPMRLDAVLKSMKDKTFSPVIPKRQYVYAEEQPVIIEEKQPKMVPVGAIAEGIDLNTQVKQVEPSIAAASNINKEEKKIFKFDN